MVYAVCAYVVQRAPTVMLQSNAATPAIEKYEVKNMAELESTSRYRQILKEAPDNVVFIIKDTGTYLAKRKPPANNPDHVENIDLLGWWWNPFAPKQFATTEWIEFSHENVRNEEYPGLIPVSACQLQEFGELGAITFGYLMGASVSIKGSQVSGVEIFILTLETKLGLTIKKSITMAGSTRCWLNPGTTGQILSRPTFATFVPRERVSVWSITSLKFIGNSEFKDNMEKLSVVTKAAYYCASSDRVNLFCDARLGVPDWLKPLGVEYFQDAQRLNATTVVSS